MFANKFFGRSFGLTVALGVSAVATSVSVAGAAQADRFEIDYAKAKIAGTDCYDVGWGLRDAGRDRVAADLWGFGVSLGTIGRDGDSSRSDRTSCAVVLPGRLPRGYTIRSVRTEGALDVSKSASADMRFASVVTGIARSDSAEVVFPAGQAINVRGRRFSLVNVIENDEALCAPNRNDDVVVALRYAVSAIKGAPRSFAELRVAREGDINVSFDIARCR